MDLERAMEIALDGDAVLFLGAGYSIGATNLRAKPFSDAKGLVKILLAAVGDEEEDVPLQDAAEIYLEENGYDALLTLLRSEYKAHAIAPYHSELMAVPWRRVYTTNYDNVAEQGALKAGIDLVPVTLSQDPRQVSSDSVLCVHLNGYIDATDRGSLLDELKLTDRSYSASTVAASPWATMLRKDVQLARAVFFVGYSAGDLDIRRILVESQVGREKLFFVVGPTPDRLTRRRASQYGTLVAEPARLITEKLKCIAAQYDGPGEEAFFPAYLREYSVSSASRRVSDQDFIDLLTLGRLESQLVSESIQSGQRYYMERKETDTLFGYVDSGHRHICVSSNLGNGKSLFLEGVRFRALERGYRVFDAHTIGEGAADELRKLAELPGKTMVLFDGYPAWLDEIEELSLNASDRVVSVYAARNALNDLLIDELREVTGMDYIPEIALDRLHHDDMQWLCQSLDEYGLWADRAGQSSDRKLRFISRDCRGQFQAFLLNMFESEHICKRLSEIEQKLRANKRHHKAVVSALVLVVLQVYPDLRLLADMWGAELLQDRRFRRDPLVTELIGFDQEELRVRSSVAARYLLRTMGEENIDVLISVMGEMARIANKNYNYSAEHRALFRDLMRFAVVQNLLPESGRRAAVIRYYEELRKIRWCRQSPLFWLQYAIACMVIGDLARAEPYFKTAYSLAENLPGYSVHQIDNHYARFLLVQATEDVTDVGQAMTNFRKARSIINQQMLEERKHYPYRVASQYQAFMDKFGVDMDQSQIQELRQAAVFVANKLELLSDHSRDLMHVRRCGRAMAYVVGLADELLTAWAAENGVGRRTDS